MNRPNKIREEMAALLAKHDKAMRGSSAGADLRKADDHSHEAGSTPATRSNN
jgi:hypothetical protein